MSGMEGFEWFCPACAREIEDAEPVVFFEGEMYHPGCVPRANEQPPQPREPRY